MKDNITKGKNVNSYSDIIAANAKIIEKTLDAFGIRAQVAEITENDNSVQYALEIVRGIKLDDILALNKDLALALAAPGGKVEILAPIPGRSLVGIIMQKPNKTIESNGKVIHKIIRVNEEEIVTYDNWELLKGMMTALLVIIANGIVRLANKIDSKASISWTDNHREIISDRDPLFNKAVEEITKAGKASPALLQRALGISYERAAKLMDRLELEDYIGPADGAKPREVLKI